MQFFVVLKSVLLKKKSDCEFWNSFCLYSFLQTLNNFRVRPSGFLWFAGWHTVHYGSNSDPLDRKPNRQHHCHHRWLTLIVLRSSITKSNWNCTWNTIKLVSHISQSVSQNSSAVHQSDTDDSNIQTAQCITTFDILNRSSWVTHIRVRVGITNVSISTESMNSKIA